MWYILYIKFSLNIKSCDYFQNIFLREWTLVVVVVAVALNLRLLYKWFYLVSKNWDPIIISMTCLKTSFRLLSLMIHLFDKIASSFEEQAATTNRNNSKCVLFTRKECNKRKREEDKLGRVSWSLSVPLASCQQQTKHLEAARRLLLSAITLETASFNLNKFLSLALSLLEDPKLINCLLLVFSFKAANFQVALARLSDDDDDDDGGEEEESCRFGCW